jgi:hypothetical protein
LRPEEGWGWLFCSAEFGIIIAFPLHSFDPSPTPVAIRLRRVHLRVQATALQLQNARLAVRHGPYA